MTHSKSTQTTAIPNEFLTRTLGEQIAYMAQKYPDDVMVNYTDRQYSRTWKEFDEECEMIARGFMALGHGKNSHISIWATNVPCWLLTFFGSAKIGAVLITVNTSYKTFELEYQLKQSDTDCLVMIDGFKGTSYVDIVNDLIPEIKTSKPGKLSSEKFPRLKTIIYAGEGECPVGMLPWENLYSLGKGLPKEKFDAVSESCTCHEIVNIQYTSGTTGYPKGVMLTHYNILNNGLTIGDGMAFTHDDKLCITVPFFHCFGMVLALMACITHGTAFVPIDIFNPKKVMDALISENCTAVHGVPTMFIAMLEHPDFNAYDFGKMRTGIMAGSPCPIKTMREVNEKMHMHEIVIVFGQTESSPGCTMTSVDDTETHRCTTVGKAFPGVECKIVNPETNEALGPGEIGEFCARGYNIMRGYYNLPEATAKAIDEDGWLHFGDLATVDKDGYYKITGRIKDMVIRGGENIYPMELEECLYHHSQIKDVQVIGVPSKKYGEEVCACVILKEGAEATVTEEDIIEYYRRHVAFFKIPRYVWFMNQFPMTPSGKVQKVILRERAVERYVLQSDAVIQTA
ncbi:MAG: AMP-binding protein [Oscillospiraceae bacterium]|nr:AMP-binding protein [Oscillospiraceae bacterium]